MIVKENPRLNKCLVFCKHCSIIFLTDPRNTGRKNLGCPFGCREIIRKEGAKKRSTDYYQSPEGKIKKQYLNARRKKKTPEEVPNFPEELSDTFEEALDPLGKVPVFEEISDSPEEVLDLLEKVPVLEERSDLPEEASDLLEASNSSGITNVDHLAISESTISYIHSVTNLIEGRKVLLEQILGMISRVRQLSYAKRKKMFYIGQDSRSSP